jgi:hypothetical protein
VTGFSIILGADGITVRHPEPLTPSEARQLAIRVLQAATKDERVLRRPAAVDEALREREGGV